MKISKKVHEILDQYITQKIGNNLDVEVLNRGATVLLYEGNRKYRLVLEELEV
jgi:hypothetical protein